jgi:serine/threonine-protein kinase
LYAPTDRPWWANRYEHDSSDLVGLQREVQAIASAVVGNVKPRTGERRVESRSVNAEADSLFFKSFDAANARTRNSEGMRNAITLCQKAIDRQPDFAPAYARMASYYLQLSFAFQLAPKESMPEAEKAVLKALQLDDTLAHAHAVLAQVLYRFRWDWSGSEKEFRRALAMNPNHGRAAFAAFLSAMGRSQEAIKEAKQARDLDPLPLQPILSLGLAYRGAGDYDSAIGEFRRGLDKDPARPNPHFHLGVTYVQHGMLRDGIEELETAWKLTPDNSRVTGRLAYAYAIAGRRTEARNILEKLLAIANRQYVSPLAIARIYTGLGNSDRALLWLDKAYQARDIDLVAPATNPDLTDLRWNRQYREFLVRIALNH